MKAGRVTKERRKSGRKREEGFENADEGYYGWGFEKKHRAL